MAELGDERASRRRMRADAARNREQILRATAELVLEQGPAVPMETIARQAGVGVATLYRHFPDRTSLYAQVQLDVLHRAVDEADAAMREEKDAFAALARYMHEAVNLRVSVVMPLLNQQVRVDDERVAAARRRGLAAVDELVARAHREHAIRPDITSADVALLIIRATRPLPGVPAAESLGLSHRHLEVVLDGFVHFLGADPLPGPALSLEDLRPAPGDR